MNWIYWMNDPSENGKRVRDKNKTKTKSKKPLVLLRELRAECEVGECWWGWAGPPQGGVGTESGGAQVPKGSTHSQRAKLCVGVLQKKWGGEGSRFEKVDGESWAMSPSSSQATLSSRGAGGTQGCVAAWNGLMSSETSHVTSVLLSVAKKLRKEDRKIGIG